MSFFDDADLDKQAAKDEEEFNSADWTPEVNEEMNAIVLSHKVVKTKWGQKLILVVRNVGDKTSGGIEAGMSGNLWAGTVLARKILEASPATGTGIKVRFEGKVTPEKGGNPYNNYTLIAEQHNPAEWVGVAQQLDDKVPTGAPAQNTEDGWKF